MKPGRLRHFRCQAQGGAHLWKFISRHAHADPRPADQHTLGHKSLRDHLGHHAGVIGIIHGFRAVATDILDDDTLLFHDLFQGFLEFKSAVIRTNRHSHDQNPSYVLFPGLYNPRKCITNSGMAASISSRMVR